MLTAAIFTIKKIRKQPKCLYVCVCVSLSLVCLFATLCTHHVPLSMGLSRQEYWSGLPFRDEKINCDIHGVTKFLASKKEETLPFVTTCIKSAGHYDKWNMLDIGRKKVAWSYLYVESKKTRGFPGGASGKESASQCRRYKTRGFDPCVGKVPWRRAWQPTPIFLPGIVLSVHHQIEPDSKFDSKEILVLIFFVKSWRI